MNNFDQLMTELKSGNSSHYYVSPVGYPISPCLYYKGALLDWLCGCAIDVHADIQNISEQETADLAQALIDILRLNEDGKIPLLVDRVLPGEEPYRVGSLINNASSCYPTRRDSKDQRCPFTEGFQRLLDAIQRSGVGSVNDNDQAHELCLRAEESVCDMRLVSGNEGERLLLVSVALARVAKDLTTSNGVMVPTPSTTQIYIKRDMIEDAAREYSERLHRA
jgi:hypothetical protein